jgi:hypothetical protein
MTNAKFAIIGGLLGGMLGSTVGMILDQQAHEKQVPSMDLCSLGTDEELFGLSKSRKQSLVVFYDEIKWARLEAPPARIARQESNTLQGRLTFKARACGKKVMKIHNPSHMTVAVDALPARLGDRLVVNAKFHSQQCCFVAAS